MFQSSHELTSQLLQAFGQSHRPLIIHSDLLKVGFIEKMKPPQLFLMDYLEIFKELAKNRPLFFPCFNYDYCQTGVYDLSQSRSQVGAFPDFLRAQGFQRNRAPVFNFCLLGKCDFDMNAVPENLFGARSVFEYVFKNQGDVLFLGADYGTNTFFHFTEDQMPIGYRYKKIFSGEIFDQGVALQKVQVHFLAKPKGLTPFKYDWALQKADLQKAGILRSTHIGNANCDYFNTEGFHSFISENLRKNDLWYLDQPTQELIKDAQKQYGYPFSIEQFEFEGRSTP